MLQKLVLTTTWLIIIFLSYVTWNSFVNKKTEQELHQISNTEKVINIEKTDITNSTNNLSTFDDYINIANKFKNENKYNTAIEFYQKALLKKENDTYTLNQLADTFFLNNQFQESLETLKRLKSIKPSTETDIKIIKTYFSLNEIKKAKDLLWTIKDYNLEIQYYKGIIYIIYNKFEDAKNVFNEIINAIPEGNTNKNLTELKEKSLKFTKSFETFSYYIDEKQTHLKVLLAQAMSENKDYRPSIYVLNQAIKEETAYRDAWIIMGYDYLNLNKIQESIDSFNKAKKLDPEKPETLFFLGLAYFANNDIQNAIKNIEAADKNGYKKKDEIKLKLGDLYAIDKKYKKSEQAYSELLSINQNNIEVFTRSVWLNIDKLNDKEKALKIAKQALEIHPKNAMSYNLMGWVLLSEKKYIEAESYLNKALEIDNTLAAADLNLAILYEENNKIKIAKNFYQTAFINGKNTSIEQIAAMRFNKITEMETQNYLKANVINQ